MYMCVLKGPTSEPTFDAPRGVMRLQGQGCSKLMASEFAGARPSAIRQKRHVDPGEPSCSPVRRQHARFTVMWWRLLTLIRSLRTPFARVGGCSTAGTAGMYVSRRETQEEFYAHSHEVSGEPQNTPGVLDEQRLTVSTAQRQGPRTRREAARDP